MLSANQDERAGSPKSPIAVIKNIKSKIDNVIKSWRNVCVNLVVLRLVISTITLNMLPNTPIHETIILEREVKPLQCVHIFYKIKL